jgi:hypothetical protein
MIIDRLCVNCYGGPGSGKSVLSAALYADLKKKHIDCQLVTEIATDLVLERNATALANQVFVFANTQYKLNNAYQNTKIAITDSPLLLSAIYNPNTSSHLIDLIFEQYHKFNNINIFIDRDLSHPFSENGRIHSITQSITLDNQIKHLLDANDIPYIRSSDIPFDGLVQLIIDQFKESTP